MTFRFVWRGRVHARKKVVARVPKDGVGKLDVVLAPRESFRHCEGCPELVVISAGRFRMGCLSGDSDCDGNMAQPTREVTLASFALSVTEVTVAQYGVFVAATGHDRRGCEIRDEDGDWAMDGNCRWTSRDSPRARTIR